MEENTTLLGEIKSEQYKNKVKLTFVWLWRFCIFAVTGSSSVHVTRMLLHWLHCQGSNAHEIESIEILIANR